MLAQAYIHLASDILTLHNYGKIIRVRLSKPLINELYSAGCYICMCVCLARSFTPCSNYTPGRKMVQYYKLCYIQLEHLSQIASNEQVSEQNAAEAPNNERGNEREDLATTLPPNSNFIIHKDIY